MSGMGAQRLCAIERKKRYRMWRNFSGRRRVPSNVDRARETRAWSRFVDHMTSLVVKNKKIKTDVMLKYYLDMTGTDYLHFGMWREGDTLSPEHVQAAQERYAAHLIELIPQEVKTVLDVGCGVGGNARKLQEKGYTVTGLAPDPYQRKLFQERTGGEIPFILSRFEDYEPDAPFDLILMSESVQYLRLDESFAKARKVLAPGGYMLTSDFYRLESSHDLQDQHLPSHFLREFLDKAGAHPFELIRKDDITEQVLPTLHYGQMVFSRYIRPTFRAQLLALKVHVPILYKILRLGLRFRIKGERVEDVLRNNLIPPSPDLFQAHMRYLIHLFKKVD